MDERRSDLTRPLDDLLTRALALPKGPQREAWLDGVCLDDPALSIELRELIEAHESAGSFLCQPHQAPSEEDHE